MAGERMNENPNRNIQLLPHSLNSSKRCFIRFVNKTDLLVEILWINYDGEYSPYRMLQKGNFVDVNTFKTHPWIARNVRTKDALLIDNKYIYSPQSSEEFVQQSKKRKIDVPENYELRVVAPISLPLHSLRYACLIALRDKLSREELVNTLPLPATLKEELKRLIVKRNRECAADAIRPTNRIILY